MAHVSDLIATDIAEYLKAHEYKSLLRFITCGSVDDGKSTLIGRLLYESKMLFEDQPAAVEADSKKFGTQRDNIGVAPLVDGLSAEREQGTAIEVADRFFATKSRKFIVADTLGQDYCTRNMVAGASTCDLAVLMIDARKGILTQTRCHSYLVSLIGIRHIVVAINKMDLVEYNEKTYRRIVEDYEVFAQQIGLKDVTFIPLSAFKGDNIVDPSDRMPWYHGTTLMCYLETLKIDEARQENAPFRMPVQWLNRPNLDFRGFSGTIAGGHVKVGDKIRAQPSGKESTVSRIVTYDGDLQRAVVGQSVTLILADEIDISRGDVISEVLAPAGVADQFETTLIWMNEEPLLPGRRYLLKIGTQTVTATVTDIKYLVNVDTMHHIAAKALDLNAIGVCNINLDRVIVFDPYIENRNTGGFILIDRMTNNTLGAGLLHFALRRSQNIHIQQLDVDKAARSQIKAQKPCVLWFTGLSGAGKSSIANLVEKRLCAAGRHTYLLDGDNIRHGLNKDLGFTEADRVENIRRVGEVARLMVDAGLIVITAFISPFKAERQLARSLVREGEFIEVFVDVPLALAEERDVKGLYKKARRGELKNFTGIDSPYENPETPELTLTTANLQLEEAANQVMEVLRKKGVVE